MAWSQEASKLKSPCLQHVLISLQFILHCLAIKSFVFNLILLYLEVWAQLVAMAAKLEEENQKVKTTRDLIWDCFKQAWLFSVQCQLSTNCYSIILQSQVSEYSELIRSQLMETWGPGWTTSMATTTSSRKSCQGLRWTDLTKGFHPLCRWNRFLQSMSL